MAGETVITVVGNLTADPELRFTATTGKSVANFAVASTPRQFDKQSGEWKDLETLFLRCTAWGELGEHVAASVRKGHRVVVIGRLVQRNYETNPTDGTAPEKRVSVELVVDELGPSLKYATASVQRIISDRDASGLPGAPADAWASSPAAAAA